MRFMVSANLLTVSCLFLSVACMKSVDFDDRDDFIIGKRVESDEELFYSSFDLTKSGCQSSKSYVPCTNNKTHFTVNFKDTKKRCISSIELFSWPDREPVLGAPKIPSKSTIFCQRGGIGKSYCLLIFKKNEPREDAEVHIRGMSKPCSFKKRYISGNPKRTDAYGLQYKFDKEDFWSLPRTGVEKWERTGNEIIYRKDGLLNTQITYLDKSDKFSSAKELFVRGENKKFIIRYPNLKDISFLDVYWYQSSQSEKPKLPYIYYKDQCTPDLKPCVVFDAVEPITYVLVKAFTNKDHTEPRLRAADLGRG
ncbi:lufaxin-like [Phlebotomus argentipes]|uniref:lufaxin-like n=1 Tax=Phlebotomus argentipes TaxID=94469 RepID=UPI002892E9E1|nr:lufaxin-like [Phlebotomus argentipes]